MKKWTIFINGTPYVIEAETCYHSGTVVDLTTGGELVGRFRWDQIDGFVEVK